MTTVPFVPRAPQWHFRLRSVGVTGTNGKTTTTRFLAAALATIASPVVRATTVGYFIGDEAVGDRPDYDGFLAIMRRAIDAGAKLAALEMTSEALARGFALAWPCQIAVFTNLTHDHLDSHGSPEHYLASKAQLFLHLPPGGAAILNAADPVTELLTEVLPAHDDPVRVFRYAVPSRGAYTAEVEESIDARAVAIETTWKGTRITCAGRLPGLPGAITVRAIGDIYAENALAALLGAVAAGASVPLAAEAIALCPPPPGRFEVVHETPFVVVDYAHSPDALARTLAIARALLDGTNGRLSVVFGAGGKRDVGKRAEMGRAAKVADRVYLTSDNPRDEDPAAIARAVAEGLVGHPNVQTILDRGAAIEAAIAAASAEDVIIVAGKGHETTQITGKSERAFSDHESIRAVLARLGSR